MESRSGYVQEISRVVFRGQLSSYKVVLLLRDVACDRGLLFYHKYCILAFFVITCSLDICI